MTTLRQLIDESKASLSPIYGDNEATWLIRTIMEHVKGWNQVELAIRANEEVSEFICHEVKSVVGRLCQYEPIQYIYSDTYWHGMTLKVSPSVLIPRPETSELVDIIAGENKATDLKVLDVCTGSGCIAVALAKSLNFPDVDATDISSEALDIAKSNASLHKVKINFRIEDALNMPSDDNRYDIIVSNPPYVMDSEKKQMDKNVLEYEPALALFVTDDNPLAFYKSIALYAKNALRDKGKLYFELNPLTADSLLEWMKPQGWADLRLIRDMYAKKRFMLAVK